MALKINPAVSIEIMDNEKLISMLPGFLAKHGIKPICQAIHRFNYLGIFTPRDAITVECYFLRGTPFSQQKSS